MQDNGLDISPSINSKAYNLQEPVYKLKSDDIISVEVFSLTQEKFNFLGNTPRLELTVDKQGDIELPVVGNLKVAGLTLFETQEKIKVLTADYLKSPKITVKLTNVSFTVLGEVRSQGTFEMDGSNVTVLEAIGQAGGLTDFADRSNIRILRHEQSKASVYKIDILEDNLLLSDRYFIQPNDVIIVDPLKAKNLRGNISNITLALSIITTLSFIYLRFQ
jgi:polysaccharide export outer membrane protein